MSAIGGVVTERGGDTIECLVRTLAQELAARGPDGGKTLAAPPCTMVFKECKAVSSTASQQPHIGAHGLVVTFDGRLDNRTELLSHFSLAPDVSDVDIVCAAFELWREQCLSHLIGDYSLAAWDPRAKTVWLARDPFGTRPLYYHQGPDVGIWASELGALVAALKPARDPDGQFVSAFLTSTEDWTGTPYRGVRSVAPGSLVQLREASTTSIQWWKPDPSDSVRYAKDDEYAEHFGDLFRNSVRRRLRANGPVMAELSGGLDSSSIACVAATLVGREGGLAPRLYTASYVYPDAPTADESRFIKKVEDLLGIESCRIADRAPLSPILNGATSATPNPLCVYDGTFTELKQSMDRVGARVLLCGQAGDHVLMHEPGHCYHLADYFLAGRWADCRRYLAGGHQLWGLSYSQLFWNSVVWPILPAPVRAYSARSTLQCPTWVAKPFARATRFGERFIGATIGGGFTTYAGRRQYSLLMDAISMVSSCYYRERIAVDVAYPFLDRDLVEFLLAIPPEQKLTPDENRAIQRRAMRGVLPESIRRRKSKRGPDEALCRAIVREWPRLERWTRQLRMADYGFVDATLFRAALNRARHGMVDQLQPIARALALEAWLRGQDDPRSPAPQPTPQPDITHLSPTALMTGSR